MDPNDHKHQTHAFLQQLRAALPLKENSEVLPVEPWDLLDYWRLPYDWLMLAELFQSREYAGIAKKHQFFIFFGCFYR